MSAGRKSNVLWEHFKRVPNANKTGWRAICNSCQVELQGVLDRMKKHFEQCRSRGDIQSLESDDEDVSFVPGTNGQSEQFAGPSAPKKSKNSSIENFVIKTSKTDKMMLDEHVAKFFYASNLSFRRTHNKEFLKLCSAMRPGYVPPNEKQMANELLDKIYDQELQETKKNFKNNVVCLAIDGWSNINNNPLLSSCIIKEGGVVALVDSCDTSGSKHDVPYVTSVTQNSVHKAENTFDTKVGSIVTDNHICMAMMRTEIERTNPDIITYGCSAHILNLLAHDIGKTNNEEVTLKRILHVVKYFR